MDKGHGVDCASNGYKIQNTFETMQSIIQEKMEIKAKQSISHII